MGECVRRARPVADMEHLHIVARQTSRLLVEAKQQALESWNTGISDILNGLATKTAFWNHLPHHLAGLASFAEGGHNDAQELVWDSLICCMRSSITRCLESF